MPSFQVSMLRKEQEAKFIDPSTYQMKLKVLLLISEYEVLSLKLWWEGW